jgi:hypothetical protein
MQVQNNEDLLSYNAREIKSIRVITQPYRYGPKIYSGIISVITKKGDFVPTLSSNVKELDLPPAIKKKVQYKTDYNNKAALSRIPDFRVQLLWKPDLTFEEESYSTSFFTSDVSGDFEVTIEGYTGSGQFISAKSYFKVDEN